MEAEAQYDFIASAANELGFTKGQVLKVLFCMSFQLSSLLDANMTGWCKAEIDGRAGYIPIDYVELKEHNWFYGQISRDYAEKLLMPQAKDTFLVRGLESNPKKYVVSVKDGDGVGHYKVFRDTAGSYFFWLGKKDLLNKLVRDSATTSVSRTKQVFLRNCLERVIALYDYEGADEDELQLREGDIICVTEKLDSNWWTGIIGDREGMFPANFVEEA